MTSVSWIFQNFLRGQKDSITPTTVGRYYKVTSFSPTDSKLISDALSSSNDRVYLNDSGGVVSINGSRNFKNGLTGQTEADLSNISIIKLSPGNNKYVFSKPFGAWALYRKTDNEMFLVYNPVPRPEVDRLIEAKGSSGMQSFKSDIEISCKENGTTDPICLCIDGPDDDSKFCMDDLMTPEARKAYQRLDRKQYDLAEGLCGCANTKCLKDHPFNKNHYRKVGSTYECKGDISFTVCNTTLDAGGNLKTGNVNIEQRCGSQQPTPPQTTAPTPTATPPAPTVTPPAPTVKPPVPTVTPPAPTATPTATPATTQIQTPPPAQPKVAPTTVSKQPVQQSIPPPKSNTMLYVIIGVVLLLLIIGIVIFFAMDDSPSAPTSSRVYRRRK